MKVNDVSSASVGYLKPEKIVEKKAKEEKTEEVKTPAYEDTVELSSRQKRVDEIKAQVENGTYKVDSEKVADKFLRSFDMVA